jgi:hypothetical protein
VMDAQGNYKTNLANKLRTILYQWDNVQNYFFKFSILE